MRGRGARILTSINLGAAATNLAALLSRIALSHAVQGQEEGQRQGQGIGGSSAPNPRREIASRAALPLLRGFHPARDLLPAISRYRNR